MSTQPKQPNDRKQAPVAKPSGTDDPETAPAEERGERLDTGKTIARGGKQDGHVPGAEPDRGRQ